MHPPEAGPSSNERLAEVLRVHFHPQNGAPWWIERARSLGFDPRERIQSIDELQLLGLMDQRALRERPLTYFIPRSIAAHPEQLIVVQTGGTLGEPIWSAYTPADYEAAFVAPFVDAARHVSFPPGGTWLFVGPSGPHVIGRAARSISRATGAAEPFTVDFDSRWARKLPADSFAARRYLLHVVDQSMDIIEHQQITHLFSTPPVLTALGLRMTPRQRECIRGVHYGGMALTPQELTHLQQEVFPAAVHLSGYGNTLFGCCLELETSRNRPLCYFPHGNRVHFSVLEAGGNVSREIGARGRCVFSRLDPSMLLVNFLERDEVELIAPPPDAPEQFNSPGVLDPHPAATTIQPGFGIY